MADSTVAPHDGRAEKHRFTCGKQDFTISSDPVTGRWSHNRIGADSFLRLAEAERAQFQIVQIVCELLTEGIVQDAACAITDGKKLWRLYIGQSPQLAQESQSRTAARLPHAPRTAPVVGGAHRQAGRAHGVCGLLLQTQRGKSTRSSGCAG